jgi:hypothetical protein
MKINMEQEVVNQILAASDGNIYKYTQGVRRRMKLYFFLLVISLLCNVALIWLWHDAIKIARICIAGM